MKRLMMTIAVVVVLLGISDKALAQSRWLNWCFTGRSFGGYGRGHSRGEYIYIGTPARSRWLNWTSTRGRYDGRYGYYGSDKTLRRVTGYGGLGRGIVRDLHEMSMDNELLRMAKEEQNFRHELIREEQAIRDQQIRRIGSSTVLRTRVPIRRIIKPKKVQGQKSQEIQQLQQEKKELQIQLKKLQQELEKAKK